MSFEVKDSGERQDYPSGMRRDTQEGKTDFLLALDGPMFKRYADHLTKGAAKYGKRNWQLADSVEERDRFKASAMRHFVQWLDGDQDEDHAAAVMFNINACEYVKDRIDSAASLPDEFEAFTNYVAEYYGGETDDMWSANVSPVPLFPRKRDYQRYIELVSAEQERFNTELAKYPVGWDGVFFSEWCPQDTDPTAACDCAIHYTRVK